MKWIRMLIAATTLAGSQLVSAQTNSGAQFVGIYRHVSDPDKYLSIHVNMTGYRMVVIDMAVVEDTGDALRGTYVGIMGGGNLGGPEAELQVIKESPGVYIRAEIPLVPGPELEVNWCYGNGFCPVAGTRVRERYRKLF